MLETTGRYRGLLSYHSTDYEWFAFGYNARSSQWNLIPDCEKLYIGFGVEIILFVFIQKVSRIQRNCTKYLMTIALSF